MGCVYHLSAEEGRRHEAEQSSQTDLWSNKSVQADMTASCCVITVMSYDRQSSVAVSVAAPWVCVFGWWWGLGCVYLTLTCLTTLSIQKQQCVLSS